MEDASELRAVRDELVRGARVTSRWLAAGSSTPATALAHEAGAAARLAAIARQDMEDIDACDVFAIFNPESARSTGRGGRHVETGYALALGKRVIIVGVRGNVFHWLPEITAVTDWSDFIALFHNNATGEGRAVSLPSV